MNSANKTLRLGLSIGLVLFCLSCGGMQEAHYENGAKKSKGAMLSGGERDGRWTTWYRNGSKMSEGDYRGGVREGVWTFWYENGVKTSEGKYLAGKPDGSWSYWDVKGNLSAEMTYREGAEVSAKVYEREKPPPPPEPKEEPRQAALPDFPPPRPFMEERPAPPEPERVRREAYPDVKPSLTPMEEKPAPRSPFREETIQPKASERVERKTATVREERPVRDMVPPKIEHGERKKETIPSGSRFWRDDSSTAGKEVFGWQE